MAVNIQLVDKQNKTLQYMWNRLSANVLGPTDGEVKPSK